MPLGTFTKNKPTYTEHRADWLIKGTEAKKDIMIIRDVIKGE